jgi:hypothetical protein
VTKNHSRFETSSTILGIVVLGTPKINPARSLLPGEAEKHRKEEEDQEPLF